jgi:hypothetical protein
MSLTKHRHKNWPSNDLDDKGYPRKKAAVLSFYSCARRKLPTLIGKPFQPLASLGLADTRLRYDHERRQIR